MTYSVDEFTFGKSQLEQARNDRDAGRTGDARSKYNSAITTFTECQAQHPEAADLLVMAQQELQALG